MAQSKCPYCGGARVKTAGRVVRLQSHLAYGYGERMYRCRKCGETFAVRYSIPPKFPPSQGPNKNPNILKVNFKEGVSGFANPCVLTATISVPSVTTQPAASENKGSDQKSDKGGSA